MHMKRFVVWLALALFSAVALALPSVEQVQEAVKQGHFEQAETMMREVVDARPRSAKAHYIYAEILAHNGKRELAIQEAQTASKLDPAIGFTNPEKFRSFEQALSQSSARPNPAPVADRSLTPVTPVTPFEAKAPAAAKSTAASASSDLPGWMWGVGGLLIAVMVWRMVNRRAAAPLMMAGAGSPNMPYGYPPAAQPGGGSGLLGVGLAGAGGFAAGMLAEKLLHAQDHAASAVDMSPPAATSSGLSTDYFNNDAPDLQDRSIDFGNGGDWGGDNSSSDGGSGDW
jgi:tetratricopeptide (TPR) repeat protein